MRPPHPDSQDPPRCSRAPGLLVINHPFTKGPQSPRRKCHVTSQELVPTRSFLLALRPGPRASAWTEAGSGHASTACPAFLMAARATLPSPRPCTAVALLCFPSSPSGQPSVHLQLPQQTTLQIKHGILTLRTQHIDTCRGAWCSHNSPVAAGRGDVL